MAKDKDEEKDKAGSQTQSQNEGGDTGENSPEQDNAEPAADETESAYSEPVGPPDPDAPFNIGELPYDGGLNPVGDALDNMVAPKQEESAPSDPEPKTIEETLDDGGRNPAERGGLYASYNAAGPSTASARTEAAEGSVDGSDNSNEEKPEETANQTLLQKAQSVYNEVYKEYSDLKDQYDALSDGEKASDEGKSLKKQIEELRLGRLSDAADALDAAKKEDYVNSSPEVTALASSLEDMGNRYKSLQDALNELLGKKEEEDKEKTERDKWRTFWSGIGEIGSSLVNQMGVSGVFGGRNAYGKGAYSSMMKFNLTTKEFSDQTEAAHEKRQKAIDDLEKQRLSLQEKIDLYLTQGAATLGQLKATRGDKYDDLKAAAAKAQADYEKAMRDYELELMKMANALEIAKIRGPRGGSGSGSGRSGSSSRGSASNNNTVNWKFENWKGESVTVRGNRTTIDSGLADNAENFANNIAAELGFSNYSQFRNELRKITEQAIDDHNNRVNSDSSTSESQKKKERWDSNHKLTKEDLVQALREQGYIQNITDGNGNVTHSYTDDELAAFVESLMAYYDITATEVEKAKDEFLEGLRPYFSDSADAWSKTYGKNASDYGQIMQDYIGKHSDEETADEDMITDEDLGIH